MVWLQPGHPRVLIHTRAENHSQNRQNHHKKHLADFHAPFGDVFFFIFLNGKCIINKNSFFFFLFIYYQAKLQKRQRCGHKELSEWEKSRPYRGALKEPWATMIGRKVGQRCMLQMYKIPWKGSTRDLTASVPMQKSSGSHGGVLYLKSSRVWLRISVFGLKILHKRCLSKLGGCSWSSQRPTFLWLFTTTKQF